MKKLLSYGLIVTINLILATTNIFAQEYVELDKISDIRAQEEGTYVFYTGEAITTFYSSGGILIQDETGSIYVKSYDLSKACAAPADAGFPNQKITAIAGVFHKAVTNEEMTHIQIEYDTEAYDIEVLEKNVDFTITDVTLEDLMADPMKYECQPIRLNQVTATITEYTKYFKLDDKELIISTGQMGEAMDVPAEGTFVGYYGNNGTQGFIIPDSKYITPTAYKSVYDIKNSGKTGIALGILDPVLVNRVVKNTDGSTTLYIQEDYSYWGTYGTTVIVENLIANVQEGDSIIGVRGYVTPFSVVDGKIYGSKIEQKGDLGANIQILSSNNTLASTRVQELEYIKGEAATNYEATLCSTPAGTIVKHGEKYYLRVVHSNTNMADSILIEGADFSELIGSKNALIGIVDAGIINPGYTTLILRSSKDILLDNYQFNTIAELRAAGRPLAADVTYELVNPVLVTYKREYNIDGVDLIGVHVQDATGGYYIKKQVTTEETFDINAGDSVTNFKGVFVNTARTGYMLDFTDINNTQEDSYKIISSGNAVDKNPINVTIKELAANPNKYSSRVIRLQNVMQGDTTYTAWWTGGYPVTDYYLYQEGSSERMFYSSWNYPLYEKNTIIGVFDDACDSEGFTIIPLSAAHITDASNSDATNVNQITSESISLAYNNNTIFLSSKVDAIEIYNTNGALVMREVVNSTNISVNLAKGIYIVRLFNNGEITTNKIAIK